MIWQHVIDQNLNDETANHLYHIGENGHSTWEQSIPYHHESN